jgi:hypothetical protein
VDLEKRRVKL